MTTRALLDLLPWGQGGGSRVPGEGGVDYDALFVKILNDDRFHAILEKIASDQVKVMEDKLGEELRLLEVRLACGDITSEDRMKLCGAEKPNAGGSRSEEVETIVRVHGKLLDSTWLH